MWEPTLFSFICIMKKILYIDLDGVCANFDKRVLELYPGLNLVSKVDRGDVIDKICESSENFFIELEPIKDSVESILELSSHYEIYFLSTPMYNVPASYTHKRIWLEKHFQDFAKKKLILTHRKDLCIGHFLVDDRTKNGAGEFKGVHIHFGQGNFKTWKEVKDFLIQAVKTKVKIDFNY